MYGSRGRLLERNRQAGGPPREESMIELRDLTIKYGDFTAVNQISVTIQDGEFFTFLGPSGCGKTTTLRSISGFEKTAGGQILVDGADISRLLPEERNIGFVFQNYALFPSMTVYENIAFGLRVKKTSKAFVKSKVECIAEKLGIEAHLGKKISELSGGQQQRIAVARALVVEPRILLMDEPLSNLDAKLRISMREEIKRLQSDLKITTIYVTHDQEEALAISDRIAVFNQGTVEQIGDPGMIYHQPATPFVAEFIGDIHCLTPLAQQLVQDGDVQNARLYIRPQAVAVHTAPVEQTPERVVLKGYVGAMEFLGAYSKVIVDVPEVGKITSLLFQPHSTLQPSEEVWVSFARKDVLVFGGAL